MLTFRTEKGARFQTIKNTVNIYDSCVVVELDVVFDAVGLEGAGATGAGTTATPLLFPELALKTPTPKTRK